MSPAPVRCPAIEHPDMPPADLGSLAPLLTRLAATRAPAGDEAFPLGTLRPDGRLDLCKQGLGTEGAARLLPAAFASQHAIHLLLGTNAIGNSGARAIAEQLPREHRVRTLYLGCNRIDGDGAAALAERLADDHTVRGLWLKRNPIGDAGVRAIAAMLRRNQVIRTLDLVNTGLSADGLGVLLAALTERPVPLERLYLGGNGLDAGAAGLLAALIRDTGIGELYLTSNHLGDRGAATVAGAVRAREAGPSRPVRLGLGGNGIGPDGAGELAGALAAIEALDLGRAPSERALGAPPNQTGDEGASALAAGLAASPLRRLDLSYTGLTGRGAKALLAAMTGGSQLESVGLGPGVPRRVKREIAQRLRPPASIHPDLRAIGSVYR